MTKKLARFRSDIECAAVNHFTEMNDMGFNIALKSNFLKLAIILIPSIFICHNSSGYGHEQIRYRGNPEGEYQRSPRHCLSNTK